MSADLEEYLGRAFQFSPEAMLVLSHRCEILAFNPGAENLTGWLRSEVAGHKFCETLLAKPSHLWEVPREEREFACRRADGSELWVEMKAAHLPLAGGGSGALITLRDATAVRDLRDRLEGQNTRLREQAQTDALTGLGNRFRLFEEQRRMAGTRASAKSGKLAEAVKATIAMLDVDNMKCINDDCGHVAGDKVLQGIGNVLQRYTRQADVAIRYGGDEFVLLLPQTTLREAQKLMRRLINLTSKLGTFLELPMDVSVSYGLAEMDPEDSLEEALVRADRAMYRRKLRRRVKPDRAPTSVEQS